MKHSRLLAGLAASVFVVGACGSSGGGGDGGEALKEVGDGEGSLKIVAWAGYAEDGSTDPAYNWVKPFDRRDRVQGRREDRQHLRRDVPADVDR